jgi:MinD-like ATPase involved in chromosome partitioning or flagellar assembly
MSRQAVVIALPPAEAVPVAAELRAAGFDAMTVTHADELAALFEERRDIAVVVIDCDDDLTEALEYYDLLHEGGRAIPALMVVSDRAIEQFAGSTAPTAAHDELVTRPYAAESLRWRIEAMCIRSQTVDDGSGPVLQNGPTDADAWSRRATVISVFNPKGGVGKTTIATNLAAALQLRRDQKVLLVDADTVTGHVTTSLGLEQVRTVRDSWLDEADGGPSEAFEDIAAEHQSGVRVVALTSSPLDTEILDPTRVGEALSAARRGFDYVIADLHPSYSPLNRAIFERSDRILVPVTPDIPAIRAAVQLCDIAEELGIRDRLALVINRANSGVSVADMEQTVGLPALAQIGSGGLLLVRAANEGRTVTDMYPKERITADFDELADRIMGTRRAAPAAKSPFRFLARRKEAVSA